jgi:hypothetical protein
VVEEICEIDIRLLEVRHKTSDCRFIIYYLSLRLMQSISFIVGFVNDQPQRG